MKKLLKEVALVSIPHFNPDRALMTFSKCSYIQMIQRFVVIQRFAITVDLKCCNYSQL